MARATEATPLLNPGHSGFSLSGIALDIPDDDSPSIRDEAKVLTGYLLPIVGTQFLEYSLFVVSIVTVGHLGVTELAAASLGSMTANLVALSIIQGFCLALDSLCTQSYSSAAPKTTSLHALRTLVILFGLLIPQAIILWFSEDIMLLLRQDAEVASLTAVYLRIIILGLPAYAVFEVLRRWLQAQGRLKILFMTLAVAAPFNAILNVALVWWTTIGFIGAPIATVVTMYVMCLFTALYVIFFCPRDAWGGFSSACFRDLGPNFSLGLAGTAMVASESWAWEIIQLASSYLGPKHLAAQSILGSSQGVFFQVAVSIRVGNLIGAQRPQAARAAAIAGMGLASIIAACSSILLMVNRYRFAYLFTSDEEVAALTVQVVPILALFQLFDDVSASNNGVLRGAGRSMAGAFINVIAYYPISMPLGYYLTFMAPNMGLSGIWLAIATSVAASLLLSIPIILQTDWDGLARDALERHSKCHEDDDDSSV